MKDPTKEEERLIEEILSRLATSECERAKKLSEGIHYPIMTFRWFEGYQTKSVLQQQCISSTGEWFWKEVPTPTPV